MWFDNLPPLGTLVERSEKSPTFLFLSSSEPAMGLIMDQFEFLGDSHTTHTRRIGGLTKSVLVQKNLSSWGNL
ncbi:hypothetical protein SAMN05216311_11928 [Chitinophaga sp. CF418]|nr:hypothetical protein SAMN05216311_11928 [Chitinophaga sp. CF418]